MTTYVQHPSITEDSEICIATPNGPVNLKSVAGVFEWPEGVSLHRGFVQAAAPVELIEAQRQKDKAELLAKAKAFGLKIVEEDDADLSDDDNKDDVANDNANSALNNKITELEADVANAQAALDANPTDEELKKNLTKAKTALTKAKKSAE